MTRDQVEAKLLTTEGGRVQKASAVRWQQLYEQHRPLQEQRPAARLLCTVERAAGCTQPEEEALRAASSSCRLSDGGRMLWLLFCLLPLGGSGSFIAQDVAQKARHNHEATADVMKRPQIYYCRSPNMEDFTCWWHPLDNLTAGEEVAYVLTYSKDMGVNQECPDYTSAGPNSCHFDKSHTSIWKLYCMNVTAVTAQRNYTSQEYCLDVAEIVETESPVNLTFSLMDAGGDEAGHSAQISWTYPVPEDLRYGWITLVYELQYRRINEEGNWKVKHPLREPHVVLLGLRSGEYVVRVRCRSHNYGLWSKWSSTLHISIPFRRPTGKILVLVLVVGVGLVALLVIAFGVIPQSRRLKDYFFPPIPKPRIIGIDPLLLKKGNFEEINRHFTNFHGYRPPSYSVEVWDQVSSDGIYLSSSKERGVPPNLLDRDKGAPVTVQNPFPTQSAPPYVLTPPLPPYCASPPQAPPALQDSPSPWQSPEMISVPGTDYSKMEHPGPPPATTSAPPPANAPVQDFYTCVQLMRDSGEVHLVPCLPSAYCQEFPVFPDLDAAKKKEEEEEKKRRRLSEYQAGNTPAKTGGENERSEAADPLLPIGAEDTS
ncbi:PREDICTED: growth hormone receptor-like [Cyprinodon variegatus]|nr:PREDICTED: growth hormone receptor-like [Cyprinodon variegatus]